MYGTLARSKQILKNIQNSENKVTGEVLMLISKYYMYSYSASIEYDNTLSEKTSGGMYMKEWTRTSKRSNL